MPCLAGMFKELDTDRSGTLDKAELQALAVALGSSLTDAEISSAFHHADTDGDGSVGLDEFLEWFEATNAEEQTRRGGKQSDARLLTKLETWTDMSKNRINEDVHMPGIFVCVHVDAASRIQTLKVDQSRTDRQLLDVEALEAMRHEVDYPRSRTPKGETREQRAAEFVDQTMAHIAALLSVQVPQKVRKRSKLHSEDEGSRKVRGLLAVVRKYNAGKEMKPALWAGEAACLVRCGQPRAAMRLLRKAGDALAKGSAPLPERANSWLNEAAALLSATDYVGALTSAERAAGALHAELTKFESSATVAGFFQRALITREWLDIAALLCVSLYTASRAHLAQGQRAPAVAALCEGQALAAKWLGEERPLARVLGREHDAERLSDMNR